jgi:hypothetical protein
MDIWPLYLFHDHAQTINAAISLRAHCALTPRSDHRVGLVSEDTGEHVVAAGPNDLHLDRLPLVARLGPLARTFDFVADAAPGVKEILTVGKVCYEVRERHYDLVVVDAAASGELPSPLAPPRAEASPPPPSVLRLWRYTSPSAARCLAPTCQPRSQPPSLNSLSKACVSSKG